MTWQPIARRRNDRPSTWIEVEGAPMTLAEARVLIGQAGRPTAPGHFFAHRIEGNTTTLVWKPAKGALA